ncbi:metalloregulator ArsR/SmtB family transcription factor [Glycomyces sp. L485]|uniref:ArsR/SmtB family transcription factor n=1 Tax=Glycomyces sp. L485 TaxID=2909235 RepID=UPI001F4BB0AC|nr:metalloregulator ArsR/SmtB family transcription factor [Glycomyces sp. L485]MCH7230995.1 metalloregulator ArsR/SmtB family transcription factor [Glycomyces sp. L485]
MHDSLSDFSMPDDEQVQVAADALRMLSDPTRLKLMWALLQGEENVACLADLVGARPTAVSQHLAKLRLAGLVTTRREGTFVYYSAAHHHILPLVEQALSHAAHLTGRPLAALKEERRTGS